MWCRLRSPRETALSPVVPLKVLATARRERLAFGSTWTLTCAAPSPKSSMQHVACAATADGIIARAPDQVSLGAECGSLDLSTNA
mmetsp:Transcript_87905/g.273488  ORF Transcript_87905/g.273488 Transcript_87905/m.273488 type:complete len:85 (+) Transcript_87905:225-479(+)